MAIITIDDKEYETENFTEDQTNMLKEIQTCSIESNRASYANQVFNLRSRTVIDALTKSLEDVDDNQAELDL